MTACFHHSCHSHHFCQNLPATLLQPYSHLLLVQVRVPVLVVVTALLTVTAVCEPASSQVVATLRWKAPTYGDCTLKDYELQCVRGGEVGKAHPPLYVAISANDTSCTVPGLLPGALYVFKLTAHAGHAGRNRCDDKNASN